MIKRFHILKLSASGGQVAAAPVVPKADAAGANIVSETTLVVAVVLSGVLAVLITVAIVFGYRKVRQSGKKSYIKEMNRGRSLSPSSFLSGSSSSSPVATMRSRMYIPEPNVAQAYVNNNLNSDETDSVTSLPE